jgi:hypothetical protein
VAGAYARRMERGQAWMVPERDREQYNAWSARREAARQRNEGRRFRRGAQAADLQLRAADVQERRLRNELTAREAMRQEQPWRPEVVDMGDGRAAMTTGPRSAVPWRDEPPEPEPWRPEVVEAAPGVRALMTGPQRAERLPEPEQPWSPKLVEAGEGARALMTSPRSAVPWREEQPAQDGEVPPPVVYTDPDSGVTLWRGAEERNWRHAPRDQFADRPMTAESRAYYTQEVSDARRNLEEIAARTPWTSRGEEQQQREMDEARARLEAAEAALSGGGRRPPGGGRTAPSAPAAPQSAPSAPAAPAAPQSAPGGAAAPSPGHVLLESPGGSRQYVRPERVRDYVAAGAKVVRESGERSGADVEDLISELQAGGRR